jgi:hypothetical protein
MQLNAPELERRLSELQSEVEQLRQASHENDQSHLLARLESSIGEWKIASGRLQQDTSHTLRELEALIRHERDTLKSTYDEPVKELREHATSLTEVCIATAKVAQRSFDRAEARLTSFEHEFHHRLSEVTRNLQLAVSEIRALPHHRPARPDEAAPWPFDDVTRLHSQLRELAGDGRPVGGSLALDHAGPAARELPAAGGIEKRIPGTGSHERLIWKRRIGATGLGLTILAAVGFGWHLQNRVRAAEGRAQEAELGSQRVVAEAAQQAAAARERADREITTAREMANRAERIGNVLAAPDLVRYVLSAGVVGPGASGQALWSRTRGLVFSGTRIPVPPPNGAHQLWLLTRRAPVKAATFVPEPDGTVTLVDDGLDVPGAVLGIAVTAESAAGGDRPSDDLILTSFPSVQ